MKNLIMKIKTISLIFSCFLLVFSESLVDKSCIILLYNGDNSKPYSIIYLYLDGSRNEEKDAFFIHKYEITAEKYDKIKESMEININDLEDSTFKYPYQLTFYNKGETTTFLTKYLKRYKQIIDTVISQFQEDPKIQNNIRNVTESLIRRLRYENQIQIESN